MQAIYALFPANWKEKARELGALQRARNIKSAEDLLMLNLLYQTNGKSLGGTAALLKSGSEITLYKNAVHQRLLKSTDWNNWLSQNICRSAGIIAEKPDWLGDRRVIPFCNLNETLFSQRARVRARLLARG
jgi:hypothetical protein